MSGNSTKLKPLSKIVDSAQTYPNKKARPIPRTVDLTQFKKVKPPSVPMEPVPFFQKPSVATISGVSVAEVRRQNEVFLRDKDDGGESLSKIALNLQDIQDAYNRIKNDIIATPVVPAKYIGNKMCKVLLKCENLQLTGSFKARGVCNLISSMQPSERSRGCTVSGGRNFLYAMSYFGHKQSVPISVVVPKSCPMVDRQMYKENFSIMKVFGNNQNDSNLHALSYCHENGSQYVQGTNRLDLLAGYGTLGLELLQQVEDLDAVICPVGSGGLAASLIMSIKTLKPNCLIYGVESAAAPTMMRALKEHKPVIVPLNSTSADSLAVNIASYNAYNILRSYLDKMITVEENWISRATLTILEREKLMVEGAAACPVAAILAGRVPELQGKNVVCVLSGGNLSASRLTQAIDRGMAAESRLVKFNVSMQDEPGALAALLSRITDAGADVKAFAPERSWMKRDVFAVTVNVLIETYDRHHAKELETVLLKEYPKSHFSMM